MPPDRIYKWARHVTRSPAPRVVSPASAWTRVLALFVFLSSLASWAGCAQQGPLAQGQSDPAADVLFRGDPLWLGSDGAYSTDLGNGRVLWLFGDTGVARDASRNTGDAYFIRNSLAIQTGYEPTRAFIAFHWSRTPGPDAQPSSFFAERGANWWWPGPALRVGQGLLVFGQWQGQDNSAFGFTSVGSTAFFIIDADADPSTWQPRDTNLPNLGPDVSLGTAAMIYEDAVYLYGTRDGDHHNYILSRFQLADAAVGDLSKGQFYDNGSWVAMSTAGPPAAIFSLGAPEASVHFEPRLGQFLITQSEGFGATTLAFRAAPHPEGPWTDPRTFFRPPESFLDGTFVYAGKAHPELTGAELLVTYFPSTFPNSPPLPFPNEGYPRFVKVTF